MLIADLHESIRLYSLATIKSRKITGTALAERIGVQQAHISNFLTQKRGLSIEKMDALLNVLGINVEHLVAAGDQTRGQKESTAIECVPVIHFQAAMNPTFASDEVLGKTEFAKALLRQVKAEPPDARKLWVRFVAVRADNSLSAPMHPRLAKGSILLIDRHHCSLDEHRKDEPNLYLILREGKLMVRWAEMHASQLCLRPESINYPLHFIAIDRKNPAPSFIVGRLAHIATET
jgi:transcriptional regulator with XRE-family HTH domain